MKIKNATESDWATTVQEKLAQAHKKWFKTVEPYIVSNHEAKTLVKNAAEIEATM
eukprot:Awhi_evm1s2566